MNDRTLVIGYGNTLRGDDGVGPRVAAAVAEWGLPHARALAVPQLTPELAEPLSAAGRAIFVDARVAQEGEGVSVRPVEMVPHRAVLGHCGDPAGLLALAQALYGHSPPGWWLTVPGANFALGETLSPGAAGGVKRALDWLARAVGRAQAKARGR
jgi:hydrogenase maturation protease